MSLAIVDNRADDLAFLDRVTAHLVALAAPIQFRPAQSAADRQAAFRLRYQVVVERGWAHAETMPDGLERDLFDDDAIHIVGWMAETPVCTARMVLPTAGSGLPTEASFDLAIEPRGQVVDVGRFVVLRAYGQAEHRIFAALVSQCWQESQRRGFVYGCGVASAGMLRLYRRLGMGVETLGPARLLWGEERFPIRLDILGSVQGFRQRWSGLIAGG